MEFNYFSYVNRKRNKSYKACKDWVITDWTNALAGEVGELCNKIKKIRRGEAIPNEQLEEELADIQMYLDLVADQLGIDLEKATIDKFNKVSEKKGFVERLNPNGKLIVVVNRQGGISYAADCSYIRYLWDKYVNTNTGNLRKLSKLFEDAIGHIDIDFRV